MRFSHPFSRYGLAYIMFKENVSVIEDIDKEMLIRHLKIGLSHFRMFSKNNPETDDLLHFEYMPMQYIINNNQKGDPSKGIYLSPNVITKDIKASNTWIAIIDLISKIENINEREELIAKSATLTMGIAPMAGEVNNGKKTKSNAKGSILEVACCAVTNTTPNKPCLAFKDIDSKGKTNFIPTAIIPDLDIDKMKDFIELFERISTTQLTENILSKKVFRESSSTTKAKYSRPKIYDGNFPNAPRSSVMGCIGLLASIGKWAEEAKEIKWAERVLDSLKETRLYLIKYGSATSVTFNHYIIDLAKENKLSQIINALYYSEIISDGKRPSNPQKELRTKYPLYDMFSSRFLQLFDKPSFKDFKSIRAEYKPELSKLFTLYFEKIMSIRPEIVSSAKELGLWLNYVAYKAAEEETEDKSYVDIKKKKAKHLIEIESSALSAKRPTALLAQTITRAGRLSGMDAPAEADDFMQATSNGEITLDEAKDLITAFSRLRNKWEKEPENGETTSSEESTEINENEKV
jgi:hypothetical protein